MPQLDLAAYQQTARSELDRVSSTEELEAWQQQFVGRKSPLADFSQSIKDLSPEQRAEAGKLLNKIKTDLIEAASNQEQQILANSRIPLDVTLPAMKIKSGHLHPVTQTIDEIANIFNHLGLTLVDVPEIDYDWYVFESLNMPKTHPARDDWETFFVDAPADDQKGRLVLRPHTTNFELHVMENQNPPIRAMAIGKTYRRQADVSHTPMFHQFEGLVVDRNLSIGNLVATLEYFVHNFFGADIKTRLRPYHFRFTEPSFEVDISCLVCGGKGCKICKEGWLELGGAGMTHPTVLKNGGINPDEFSGYAWGFGVERCLAMRHGLDDIRQIYDNDVRFLAQF